MSSEVVRHGGGCLLPAGHEPWKPGRFHRFRVEPAPAAERSTEWGQRRADLRLGNVFDRAGITDAPMSIFELRAAVIRDETWNPNEGDAHDAGWAAAYDRRGLLNLLSHVEARATPSPAALDARRLERALGRLGWTGDGYHGMADAIAAAYAEAEREASDA